MSLFNNKNSIPFLVLSFFGLLLLYDISVEYVLVKENHGNILTVAFLNIGQGDSIFIQAPNGNTLIVDGGPAKNLLSEIGKILPFYKRSVDMLMVTNPDADHYSGFIPFLDHYKSETLIEAGTHSPTRTYQQLLAKVKEKNLKEVVAKRGMRIMLDAKRKVFLTILFPDRDVSKLKTNDGSIVAKLTYGNTSVMLQGDSPQMIENYLIVLDGVKLKADILKTGHHGSRTSTGEEYVKTVDPTWAVISAGLNNRYGHPHQETLDTLTKFHISTFTTAQLGTISMLSDGQRWVRKEALLLP